MGDEHLMSTPAGNVCIRLGAAEEVVHLRHVILRDGLPREAAVLPDDEHSDARHIVAATDEGNIVGCATVHPSTWDNSPAWRLRGMATDPAFRSAGVGSAMLKLLETVLRGETSVHTMWCNARVPAIEFYERNGWRVVSEVFDIPTAGPHVKMTKRL
jgi:predicted GNAT family N-acyltransferase